MNPIPLILNTPISWSQWNAEIPYIHHGFLQGVFSMNGGWDDKLSINLSFNDGIYDRIPCLLVILLVHLGFLGDPHLPHVQWNNRAPGAHGEPRPGRRGASARSDRSRRAWAPHPAPPRTYRAWHGLMYRICPLFTGEYPIYTEYIWQIYVHILINPQELTYLSAYKSHLFVCAGLGFYVPIEHHPTKKVIFYLRYLFWCETNPQKGTFTNPSPFGGLFLDPGWAPPARLDDGWPESAEEHVTLVLL